ARRQDFGRLRLPQAEGRSFAVDRGDQRDRCPGVGRAAVKITADTNVLVRAITEDEARQSKTAQAALSDAEVVAVTLPALCELVWVLSRGYRIPAAEIAETIRRLINSATVVTNRPA